MPAVREKLRIAMGVFAAGVVQRGDLLWRAAGCRDLIEHVAAIPPHCKQNHSLSAPCPCHAALRWRDHPDRASCNLDASHLDQMREESNQIGRASCRERV